ncbi:unnamed protein product [Protopolystoma xenopodis]|uniref:Uncharacterized protein n=1 Tax=Protopolystoma xenopodis TaxID=117903 RepID=A0A448WTV1_9PLAT|nr:unnamed protein product [Protopolystoma xenopodis]
MAKLTDDADYDAGETFENVSSSLSDPGNHDNYYGRRLRTSGDFSNSTCDFSMYTFTKRGESGDPIGIPNIAPQILPLSVKYVVPRIRLISLVNDSFRIRSVSMISSSRSNISSKALTAISPKISVYMDCTNSSDPTNPMF